MVIFCNILKKYVFKMPGFKVYWSKRGHYTASSAAGAAAGYGNGEIESEGNTPGEAVANLEAALIERREALQQKINEISEALREVREDGYQADDLLLFPKENEIRRKR